MSPLGRVGRASVKSLLLLLPPLIERVAVPFQLQSVKDPRNSQTCDERVSLPPSWPVPDVVAALVVTNIIVSSLPISLSCSSHPIRPVLSDRSSSWLIQQPVRAIWMIYHRPVQSLPVSASHLIRTTWTSRRAPRGRPTIQLCAHSAASGSFYVAPSNKSTSQVKTTNKCPIPSAVIDFSLSSTRRRPSRESTLPAGTAKETGQKPAGPLPGHSADQGGIEKVLSSLQAGMHAQLQSGIHLHPPVRD